MHLYEKQKKLKDIIGNYKSALIAFSGGVDSTLLLYTAMTVLQNSITAVTATSSTYSKRELKESQDFTNTYKIKHKIIKSEELDIPEFSDNPKNRCYYCKFELFGKLKKLASELGLQIVFDGANYDDINDYRPGMKAAMELGIVSPLKEAKLTKKDIRDLSKDLGLKTWNKPAKACLASRIPYGETITPLKLDRISKAEEYLNDLGFVQVRVRYHGDLARIELDKVELKKLFLQDLNTKIHNKLKELGFTYVTLDLVGYRQGSMNEILKSK
ncbi:ATP-dependent sacrificial sulfur transferase LarE [bacterium]|nr:ATP-dependent sacrificial sulfur transferase LarE [bacterium]